MMVMSPGLGSVLFKGVYCLMASLRTSFWVGVVVRGKPRICEASNMCSSIRKYFEDMADIARGWPICAAIA